MRIDRQTGNIKLTVGFRNFADTPKSDKTIQKGIKSTARIRITIFPKN